MTFAPNSPMQRPGGSLVRWRGRLLLIAFIAILLAGIAAFRGAGRWLVRPDPLEHADAIVILSGSMPYRAEQAAAVYRMGYAPEVWITRPVSPAEVLQSMGIPFEGEEEYDRQVLLCSGVPATAIHVLSGTIVNTEQELTEVAQQLREQRKSSVIIVTSPEHTRRVHTLWRLLASKEGKAIVCAAPQDYFDADHWWRNSRDTLSVTREFMGLLNAWLKLPVRPASR